MQIVRIKKSATVKERVSIEQIHNLSTEIGLLAQILEISKTLSIPKNEYVHLVFSPEEEKRIINLWLKITGDMSQEKGLGKKDFLWFTLFNNSVKELNSNWFVQFISDDIIHNRKPKDEDDEVSLTIRLI